MTRSALQSETMDAQDQSTGIELDDDPRWSAAQRVLHSAAFAKAGRLSAFLMYVCDRTLRGQQEEVTEQQIGICVFGREPGFNTGEDTIVRTTARAVRQKLDQYFHEEGQNDPIRIIIPKGTYIPEFQERACLPVSAPAPQTVEAAAPILVAPSAVQPSEPNRKQLFLLLITAIAAILFICVGLAGWRFWHRPTVNQALWQQLFKGDQPVLLVPGDAGLVMFTFATHHIVPLSAYSAGTYRSTVPPGTFSSDMDVNFTLRRDTGITDLVFATNLAGIPQAQGRLNIRFPRDLSVADLRTSNAILMGAPVSNPWVTLFDQELNFHIEMQPGTPTKVINRHPKSGEQSIYIPYGPSTPSNPDYALIALVNGSVPGRQVLLVEGTTTASIDAASNFLQNSALIDSALQRALNKDGSIRNFEVLIGTHNVANSGSGVSVIGSRFY